MAVVRKAKVVGLRRVDYTNRSGQPVKGYEYFFSYHDGQIEGAGAGSFYVGDNQIAEPLKIQQEIRVFHDGMQRNRPFTYVPD